MSYVAKCCVLIAFLTVLSAVGARHVDISGEAPSIPVCKIHGKVEKGENIYLSCHSEKGSPQPVYRWDMQDARKMARPLIAEETSDGSVLNLYNINRDTSGYYTCTSKNMFGSATCDITLTVLPPSAGTSAMLGVVGGVIAGGFAAAVLSAQRLFQNSTASVVGETNAN